MPCPHTKQPPYGRYRSTDRNRRMYHARRARLIALMGGECQICGQTDSLELHHPCGRAWKVRSLSRWTRIRRYELDYYETNLILLCEVCHLEVKGNGFHL